MAGLDPAIWLKARWPDERAIADALVEEAHEQLRKAGEVQATRIANAVANMIDKSS